MENLDIKNFTLVSGVNASDYILLSTSEGKDGRIQIQVLLQAILDATEPTIEASSRKWKIGQVQTQVVAEGKTPVFKKGSSTSSAILWKYEDEEETAWRSLVSWNEIKMNASDLTAEQLRSIKLTYDDLTDEDKADLRAPVTEMLATCQKKTTEATTAAGNATEAASAANSAATSANNAAARAEEAAGNASSAASSATTAAGNATEAAEKAKEAIEQLTGQVDSKVENIFVESTEEAIEEMIANHTWKQGVIYYTVE